MEDKPVVVTATLTYKQWIKQYILLWNGMLQLTEAEVDLLNTFIVRYLDLKKRISTEEERYELLFSTRNRKEIKTELGISEQVFNNRFSSLKKKGIIKSTTNSYKIDNKLIPLHNVTFKFNITD